ncbi:MAG: hypothetical protein ACRD0P_32325, partial [Stackebrandtia sp.]
MTTKTGSERRVVCLLGPVTVELNTDVPEVVDYLAEFYSMATGSARPPDWVVDARVAAAPGMRRNPYGVAYAADPSVREIVVRASDPDNLAISTRKTVRETLVGFYESRRYTMLHASAVAGPGRVIIVVGDKGSGKTTLALRGALEHGLSYLSNDHLIVYPDAVSSNGDDAARLVLTSLPTPIPVKVGTYLDLEHLLPEPWDSECLDLASYRRMTPAERYRHDVRVLYTYRRFGQDNPVTVQLRSASHGPRVTVVLARYAGDSEPVGPPIPVANPVAALMEHVRLDWMFDPMLNQRHIPRQERD